MHKYSKFEGYRGVEIHIRMSRYGISIKFVVKDTGIIVGSSWGINLMQPFTEDKLEEVSQRMVSWAVQDKVHTYMPSEVISDIYDWIKSQKDLIS